MKLGRKAVFAAFGLLLLALLGGGLLWRYREFVSRENLDALVEWFAQMGPLTFFGAMAILPLFWAPLSPFLLLAPAFGTGVAIVGSILALSFNMALSWLVSGKWFRPFFERLVARFGYSVPELSDKSMIGMAVLLRITPGVPFPLQNYLLGLARMPFAKYMAVSVPTNAAVSASLILFGDAIMKGNAALALVAVVVFVLVAVGLKVLRDRMKAKAIVEERDGVA